MAHILLIEPNTVLGGLYTQALQHAGHTVAHALGAQSAIDAADARAPDMVILEIQLPQHSGIEFLHEFRSYAEWQEIPVLVHTVLSPSHVARARLPLERDLGVRAILYKPRTTLQEIVRLAREYAVAL